MIAFHDWLGISWEQTMQGWIVDSTALTALANWVYIWGHWPVIAIVGLWLLFAKPTEYRLIRNAFLISGAIGLVIFASFPVAPPRMVDGGLVDTVTEHSYAYRGLQPSEIMNEYAAVPSLHLGWNLLVGLTLFRVARNPLVRVFGILSPAAMFLAIVLTANHFIVDGIAGIAVALVGLWLALALQRGQNRMRGTGGQAARRRGLNPRPPGRSSW